MDTCEELKQEVERLQRENAELRSTVWQLQHPWITIKNGDTETYPPLHSKVRYKVLAESGAVLNEGIGRVFGQSLNMHGNVEFFVTMEGAVGRWGQPERWFLDDGDMWRMYD